MNQPQFINRGTRGEAFPSSDDSPLNPGTAGGCWCPRRGPSNRGGVPGKLKDSTIHTRWARKAGGDVPFEEPLSCASPLGFSKEFRIPCTHTHTYLDLLRVRNFCRLAKLQKMLPFQLISAVSINTCRFANFLQFRSILRHCPNLVRTNAPGGV